MKHSMRAILIGLVASLPWAAQADVFRCVDASGQTLYSDKPCPKDAVSKSNITSEIGACSGSDCAAQRRQEAAEARERLRSEKEEAALLGERRERADLAAERERARIEAERARAAREALDARLTAMENAPAEPSTYPIYPAYPIYPVVPNYPRHARPHHRPQDPVANRRDRDKEPSVRLRLDNK